MLLPFLLCIEKGKSPLFVSLIRTFSLIKENVEKLTAS